MLAYFDTSAWNRLLDSAGYFSEEKLLSHEVFFCSCNLDEFALAPAARARELADYAWKHSNRKKLRDHVELIHAEILGRLQQAQVPCIFDDADASFFQAWEALRTGRCPQFLIAEMRREYTDAKRAFREYLRRMRKLFNPIFKTYAALGLTPEWSHFLTELYDEGYVSLMLWNNLTVPGELHLPVDLATFESLDFRGLPGCAACAEYLLALSFLAAYGCGKAGKPDLGDQGDFRHACYVGFVDMYVTDDERMLNILNHMVETKRAKVLSADELLADLRDG